VENGCPQFYVSVERFTTGIWRMSAGEWDDCAPIRTQAQPTGNEKIILRGAQSTKQVCATLLIGTVFV
jgi:hypothetical protein